VGDWVDLIARGEPDETSISVIRQAILRFSDFFSKSACNALPRPIYCMSALAN